MGILTRFKDIMASNVNALIDKSRNPEKTINEYMNQLRSDLGHVKGELTALETERDRAARELNDCESELEKYSRYAEKASADGNTSDARLYEQKKDRLMPQYETLKAKYEGTQQDTTDLSAMRDKLTSELASCEQRLAAIKGKLAQVDALEQATAAETGKRKKSGFTADDAFNRLEDKANARYDRASAEAELNSVVPRDELTDLASKYDEL